MELYLKNAQLHQQAEQQMFAQQQSQQYAMARQQEASELATQREAQRFAREGFVGDAFEPALRAYAEKHSVSVPEGRISKTDAASLLAMIKADGANATAMAKINNIQAGGSKKIQELLFKLKLKAVESKTAFDTLSPELEKLRQSNSKSRAGAAGAVMQKYDSLMDNSSPEFEATAQTMNGLKDFVAKVLKSTFGAQLSDGEREYMQGVLGSKVELSKMEREIAISRIKSNLDLIARQNQNNYEMMGGTDLVSGPSDEQKLMDMLDQRESEPGSSEDNGLGEATPEAEAALQEEWTPTGTEADSENYAPTDALGTPSIPPPPKRKR